MSYLYLLLPLGIAIGVIASELLNRRRNARATHRLDRAMHGEMSRAERRWWMTR